jgi:HTH-type transcriptional regulator/antitoxin HigA
MKVSLIAIENEGDYGQAKALVERLMASGERKDAARLAAQARLIEAWERSRWPRRTPETADVLAYLMDQHGLSRADLIPLLGTASRVSELLSGKRELSVAMVRRLRARFGVPADVLLPPERSRKRMAA